MGNTVVRTFLWVALAFLLMGCGEQAGWRRTLRQVGGEKLRAEALRSCRDGFASGISREVPRENWPPSVQAFEPMGLWAEPDGAYVLINSDAAGERGLYFPRILSDKDPLCGPTLKHVKWAEGVYWYEKKR
jgi:hypothetical protein